MREGEWSTRTGGCRSREKKCEAEGEKGWWVEEGEKGEGGGAGLRRERREGMRGRA